MTSSFWLHGLSFPQNFGPFSSILSSVLILHLLAPRALKSDSTSSSHLIFYLPTLCYDFILKIHWGIWESKNWTTALSRIGTRLIVYYVANLNHCDVRLRKCGIAIKATGTCSTKHTQFRIIATFNIIITTIIVRMFCSRAGLSLQTQEPGCFPLLSAPRSLLASEQALKRPEKIPGAPAWRWGEWIWLTGPPGLNRISSQGLNVSSIRVFDQIRDPEIPVTLCFPYPTLSLESEQTLKDPPEHQRAWRWGE